MKTIFTLIKFVFVDVNDDELTIKRKKFNELLFERFVFSIKRFIFSVFKIENKNPFIFRDFFASSTIFNNIKSDDNLLTLLKKFSMTISIAFMLSHAKAYVKKNRDYLRIIYDILKTLKNEKNFNIVI